MPVYNYKALNKQGKTVAGVVEADTPRDARARLRNQNVMVTDLTLSDVSAEASEADAKIKKKLPKIGKRVKTKAGEGKVIRQNILKETLTVALDSGEEIEIEAKSLSRISGSHRDKGRSRKGPRSRARGRR